MSDRLRRSRYYQPAARRPRQCRDGALDLLRIAQADTAQFDMERRGYCLDRGVLRQCADIARLDEKSYARNTGRNLLEQFQPFCTQAVLGRNKTSSAAAGARQALD